MSRRHADLIEVSTCAGPTGAVPAEFAWRGRRYLVREVLSRWTESGTWWKPIAVRALSGEGSGALDDRPQQWWRVEADSGRLARLASGEDAFSGGAGVYDLCFDESGNRWSLRRVMD